jgi:hypothetical protein
MGWGGGAKELKAFGLSGKEADAEEAMTGGYFGSGEIHS